MALVGSTEPRVYTPPLRELTPDTSWGFDVIWFAREVLGEPLTPWQEWLSIHALELLPPERVKAMYPSMPEMWSAEVLRFKTILVMVGRQNGKTHWAKVLIKWALFRKRLPYILGAAQTKNDAFELWEQITDESEAHPKLRKRLRRTSRAHGFEALRSKTGQYRIAGLDKKDGRGKTVNMLYLDELREHKTWLAWNALTATTKSPLIGFNVATSNAGDMTSIVLNTLQENTHEAIASGTTEFAAVAVFEWSTHPDTPIEDRSGWMQANPDCGHGRLTMRDLEADFEALEPDAFRTEVLCQRVQTLKVGKIDAARWERLADPDSVKAPDARVHVGVDVAVGTEDSPGRAYVYGCAERADGRHHIEHLITFDSYYMVVDWLVAQLGAEWFDGKVGIQVSGSPSTHLAQLLEQTDVEVVPWQGGDMSGSCLGFYTSLLEDRVRWLGADADELLDKAALGVCDQARADTWIWSRTKSLADASPFIASNIAWFMATRTTEEFESAYADDDWDEELGLDDDMSSEPDDGTVLFV